MRRRWFSAFTARRLGYAAFHAPLSEKVLAGDPAAVKRYLTFLSAGGSKYPIDLLKDAGVDMTTDEPLQLTLKKMNRVMDEMEKMPDAAK